MKSKLRVLHVIGGGEFGGAEQHILNLLKAFPADEVEATVVCFYDSVFANQLREAGIKVVTLNQFGRFDLRLLRALKHVIAQCNPDIVHTHGIKANFFARLAAKNIAPILLTTVHSNLRYDYVHPLAYLIVYWMERLTRRYNRHYIAISAAISEILQQNGIPREQISLIYNGIDLKPFRHTGQRAGDRARLLADWGLPANAFVFGTAARFVPVKGLSYLIEGFAKFIAADKGGAYRLVLVGDGSERDKLEALVDSLGLRELVHFTGFRQDVPVCLHAFDAFIHSSIYEGMGYTIVEAMASELPVAATSVGGVVELVVPDQTGLLMPPGSPEAIASAMHTLARDPQLRDRLVEQALKQVEGSFTIEQMASKTLALYRTLLQPV